MLLTGDIGGTKTVLALFDPEAIQQLQQETVFPSGDYDSLETIVVEFLKDKTVTLTGASFGVAGPVVEGKAQITNLPWVIDSAVLSQTFHIPHVYLLNDLQAIATAVPHLSASDLTTLNPGVVIPQGSMAVVAPGTGLGEGFMVWANGRYLAYPSEGGHTSFGPKTEEQMELLAYLQARFRHVSYERVCSGVGIPNLYHFLRDTGRYPEPPWLRDELAAAEDLTPVIMNAAVSDKADICRAVLRLFIEILGDEAGNMALKVSATGGVYLGGGIPPRILSHLQTPAFLTAFTNKGRFSQLLAKFPIHVIRHPKVALLGAAYRAVDND